MKKAELKFTSAPCNRPNVAGHALAVGRGNVAAARPNCCGRFRIKALPLIFCCARLFAEQTLWAQNSWIWWEGEKPSSSNFPASTWLSPSGQSELNALSASNILTAVNISTSGPYWANYNLKVPAAGTYHLYARKIADYGPFKWRFDVPPWTYASSELQPMDNAVYDQFGFKQYFPLNWVYLGDVTLSAGAHTFSLEMNVADWSNEPANIKAADFGGFDAFVLSMQPFVPRGKLQPGQKYNLAEPGKWNFESLADAFSPSALLDLRSLNENVAGQSGFVGVAGDLSGKYVLGDGTPVRFWGVNVFNESADSDSLSVQARFLAKRGINLIRFFYQLPADNPTNINAVDPAYIEGAQRTVAAYKQAGIYTELGLFWSATFTIRAAWGVPGYTNDVTGPSGILMFDDTLKAAYKQWVSQLFTATNPYTGLTLARDPAVAVIEIQNEDSFFWWSFDPTTLPPAQRENLETKFGAFLIAKYGSLEVAQSLWEGFTLPDDAPASGRMGLASPWFMTDENVIGGGDAAWSGYTPRMADQIEFLTELQRGFYEEMGDYLRNTLGCQSLIESCNWMTADSTVLLDAERYTYTANDVIDKHDYFGPAAHVDPTTPSTAGYEVLPGDYYQSLAGVLNPRLLPPGYKKVAGFPHNVSESTWVNPNRFKAEAPMLIGAYSSMADVNGFIWNGTGTLTFEDLMNEFQVSVPSLLGQFPGAALLYRRGDVAEAPMAVREERSLSSIYSKEPALISEYQGGDNFVYDAQTGTGQIDPLAMLAGKVECDYETNRAAGYVSPLLFDQMNTTNGIVESLPLPGTAHGQLTLDWSNGLFQVNTPCSQGIAGFLNRAPQVDLTDVSINSSNEFGAILVISLDNLPIAQSQKILIQAMTEDNPYGWQEQAQVFTNGGVVYNGEVILSMGQPPMNVVNITGAVTLKGLGQGHSFAARVLDENGYNRNGGVSQAVGADLVVTLPTNSLYTVLMMAPSITGQPQSQTVVQGSNANFSVSASGAAPLSYEWLFNGNPVSGATNIAFSATNVLASQAGMYSVVVTNAAGSATSAAAVLTVDLPAAITAPPQNQTVAAGADAVFNVGAAGTPPFTYQWWFDNTNLPAATNATLLLSNVQPAQAGDYFVVVSNPCGSVTSAPPATLTVLWVPPPLTWTSPASIVYGTALGAGQLNATASVPGTFVYSPPGGVLNAGVNVLSVVFTPSGGASSNAVTGSVPLVVLPAPLTVTASNVTRPYGAANPPFTGAITGLTNGDNITAIYSCAATLASPPGAYPIVPSLVDPNNRQSNYTVGLVSGALTVLQAAPTVTWTNPLPVLYGAALGPNQLNATANVPGAFAYTPANGTVLNVGTNTLSVVFTPTDTVDYSSATNSVSLVVSPASPFVSAVMAANPVGYWRLNETNKPSSGTVVAVDAMNHFNGTYGSASGDGVPGPTTAFLGFPGFENSHTAARFTNGVAHSYVTLPALNLKTNTVTITAWIYPIGTPASYCGLVFCRPSGDAAGLNFSTGGRLGYTWNQNNSDTYDWLSALVPPVQQWSFVALVISPESAVIYLFNTKGASAATHAIAHTAEAFNAPTLIGDDSADGGNGARTFNGLMDEVAVFNSALTAAQLSNLYSNAATLVTWTSPGPITYGTALGPNQLDAVARVPGALAYTPTNGTVLSAGAHTLTVIFTPADTLNYSSATSTVSLVVSPAPLTVTANNQTKTYGQTVTFAGTEFTTGGLTNGDTVTSVTLASPGSGATAAVAGSPYNIVPSAAEGTGLANYTIVYADGALTVSPASLTVTASNLTKTYGQSLTFAGTEFTTSGLLNSDTVNSATLNSSGAAATATVAGSPYTIVPGAAVGAGLNNYTIAYANGALTVAPAALTITANNQTKAYGQTVTFAGTEFTAAGLVNGDTVTSVTLTCSGAAATATVAGSPYGIVPSAPVGAGLANYTVSLVNGTLTVGQAAVMITWTNPAPIIYGTALSSNQLDAVASVPGALAYTPTNGAVLDTGTNTLSVLFTPADTLNYSSATSMVSLVVSPAPLTVTANNQTKTYGQSLTFAGTEFTTSGLLNSDTVNSATLNSSGAAATATVAGSPYTIVPGAAVGAGLNNYTIAYANGALTVNPAALTITANNQTKTYGQTVTFAGTEFTAAGLVNGDTVTSVTLTCSGAAATATVAGSPYGIVPSAPVGAGLANYTVSLVNGTLTVAQATEMIAWTNPAPIIYGTALSSNELDATVSVPGSFAYTPTNGTVLDTGTNTLSVLFTPTDTVDYSSASGSVSLVVSPAPLTVTAADASRAYGQTNPVFTGTITGVTNGDNISATYSCSAGATAAPGAYPIIPTLVSPNNLQTNYQVTLVNGTLTVTAAAPPTVVSVAPNSGPTNGGTRVTILGAGFENSVTVNFGAVPANSVEVINSTNLTAVTPPSAPVTVNVVLTNADGQSTTLTNGFTYVAPSGTPPSIYSQPANQVAGLGQTVMFSVTALGTAPLGYQWQLNAANLADNGRITGSQSNLLAIAGVLSSDAGAYQVVVTNAYGSVTSAAAMLTVVLPPVFQRVTLTNGTISLAWSSTAGQRYQVQYKTNLSQADWTNWVIVTATNSMATASDALNSSAQRFYRTLWLP